MNAYLQWLSTSTSNWWNDGAVLHEMDAAIQNGATGVTTNPLLVKRALYADAATWRDSLADLSPSLKGAEKAEEIIRRVTIPIAERFLPVFKASGGEQGYVCAQVNPVFPGDADKMIDMAKRLNAWAPNIAIKLPGTLAGLDAMEECGALGITTVGTVSFTVPQAVEIARRQWLGRQRAIAAGLPFGRAFSVIMVGRLDEYLRDIAHDSHAAVEESDLQLCGLAVCKRVHEAIKKAGYAAKLMPAAIRTVEQVTSLAGADMSISIAAGPQKILAPVEDFAPHINDPVDSAVINRLLTMPEFRRAYEFDGMRPEEFITFGATQRTLSQFLEVGWMPIAEF